MTGTKKRFVQKANRPKKMAVSPDMTTVPGLQARTDRAVWAHRLGVGSALLLSCPYQQATGYSGFRRSKEKLLIREVCGWRLFGSSPDKGSFYS